MRPLSIMLVALLVAVVACVGIAYRDTRLPRLRTVTIRVHGLSRPVRILQASDLHGSEFGSDQARLRDLVGQRRFDAAFLTGDYVHGPSSSMQPTLELAALLEERSRVVYAVRGNHDGAQLMEALAAQGVVVLGAEQDVRALPNAPEVAVVYAESSRVARLPREASGRPLTIAVSHTPPQGALLGEMESVQGTSVLALAGHTHGGQWRLPLIGAVWSPYEYGTRVFPPRQSGFFPDLRGRFVSGYYRRGPLHVHVSPGLGCTAFPFRFLSRAELTEIDLIPE